MEKWSEITLDNFNGPLDLLIHLIKEKDIDIMNINLVEITDQYLEYLNNFQEVNIEIASEYLTMAAHLIEIKTKLMLPKQEIEIEDSYENSVDDMVNRLVEYHKIKEATLYFKERQVENFDVFSKERSQIKIEKIDDDSLPLVENSIDIDKFSKIFLKIIEKNRLKIMKNTEIHRHEISPEKISEEILYIINNSDKQKWTLFQLLEKQEANIQMILAIFLSILDLTKNGIIRIEQLEDEIEIYKIGKVNV